MVEYSGFSTKYPTFGCAKVIFIKAKTNLPQEKLMKNEAIILLFFVICWRLKSSSTLD
jgi:hypothetical protein